ncbi:MAG: VWA domain-containing protein [Clostridiales bacterium]|nr:VWA domain-containing protein [Clostridiales bacterium]
MKKILSVLLVLTFCLALFAACDAGYDGWFGNFAFSPEMDKDDNYQFEEIIENPFVSATDEPNSYFSLDRNTASYSLMRRQIEMGLKLNSGSVRLEEYINYFKYDYARPTGDDALAMSGSVFDCPWNADHKLLTIGVAAEEVTFANAKPNNIVFLIDTSGSMDWNDRLPLIQQSFTMLLDYLGDEDVISIVTYAGDSRVALEGARGIEKTRIANVLQDLMPEGSTNGSGGIQKAYAVAEKYFINGGNNRVILATDGDFNVGISSKDGLNSLISSKRDSGIYLSVLGVGMYNTNDVTMETLARNGNGNYAYLDSVSEARKVLVEELQGTINVVAKDAKIGVEFNPEVVSKYRLIGYDTKLLTQEQFEDAATDAGEIGSGHTVTAVYELELKDGATGKIADAEIRYKVPDNDSDDTNDVSKSITHEFTTDDYTGAPSNDSLFISCVVEYGLILRESDYRGNASFDSLVSRLNSISAYVDADQFKAEFVEIVKKAQTIYSEE